MRSFVTMSINYFPLYVHIFAIICKQFMRLHILLLKHRLCFFVHKSGLGIDQQDINKNGTSRSLESTCRLGLALQLPLEIHASLVDN